MSSFTIEVHDNLNLHRVVGFGSMRAAVDHIKDGGWEEDDYRLIKTAYHVRTKNGWIVAIGQYRMATMDESTRPVLMFNYLDPLTPNEVYYYENVYAKYLTGDSLPTSGAADVGMTRVA